MFMTCPKTFMSFSWIFTAFSCHCHAIFMRCDEDDKDNKNDREDQDDKHDKNDFDHNDDKDDSNTADRQRHNEAPQNSLKLSRFLEVTPKSS